MKAEPGRLATLLTGVSGAAMLISGILLLLSPPEDLILWKGWTAMGMDYDGWFNIFLISAALFFLSALVSLTLRGKIVMRFLRDLSPLELVSGAAIISIAIVGTYLDISPISSPARMLNQWKSGQAENLPIKGLKSMSVEELCSLGGINAACCLSLLTEKGFKIERLDMTLTELVQSSGRGIEEVIEILKLHMESRLRERFGDAE